MMVNLGTISTQNIQPIFAYGILRSSSLPKDALCLSIQGIALGSIFGNPILGATAGAIAAFTDRIYAPIIDQYLPGMTHNVMGLPLGMKNITLITASMLTSYAILKAISYVFRFL